MDLHSLAANCSLTVTSVVNDWSGYRILIFAIVYSQSSFPHTVDSLHTQVYSDVALCQFC